MTPTDEEIDEEVAFLRSNLRAPKAADMLLALKARAETTEAGRGLLKVANELLAQRLEETVDRAEAAEKELFAAKDAPSKVDADPVAWQNRYRSRSGPSEEWSEWSEWRDGKQPELRKKAEDGGCYDTEERPLYTLETKP